MSGISISTNAKDTGLILCYSILSAIIATLWHPPLLVIALFLYGPPILYLAFRASLSWFRNLAGAVLLGPVFGLMFDVFGYVNGLWTYQDSLFLVPLRLFGTPADILLWSFVWALYAESLFEHFFERPGQKKLSLAYAPMLLFSFLGCAWLISHAASFHIAHAYLWSGIFSLWPLMAALFFFPKERYAIGIIGCLALPLNIAFEWSACVSHYWVFAGSYIETVRVGACSLPAEELVFWVAATPFILICNFLLFVRKKPSAAPEV